jgi:hypothetical protein
LKEAERNKKELEAKLSSVNARIEETFPSVDSTSLQNSVSRPRKAPNLQNSDTRREYMTEEAKKASEATEAAKKMREEQLKRERRRLADEKQRWDKYGAIDAKKKADI